MGTHLECIASPRSRSVFVRVIKDRRLRDVLDWPVEFAVRVSDEMMAQLRDADIRGRYPHLSLDVFATGEMLEVDWAQVEPLADALVKAACRASGARA